MRRCTLVLPVREEVNSWNIWSLLSLSPRHDLGLSRRELPKDIKLVQLKASCSPWAPIHLRVCLWHLQGNCLIGGLTTETHPMSANDTVGNSIQSSPSSGRHFAPLHKIKLRATWNMYHLHYNELESISQIWWRGYRLNAQISEINHLVENKAPFSSEMLPLHKCMSQDASICTSDHLATSAQTQNIWEP